LLETLVDKEKFENFTNNSISINELINHLEIFDEGINEEIKNVIKKLTYQDKYQRYQRAKEVIVDIKRLLELFNCDSKYELNISDNVKKQFEEDFNKSSWDILKLLKIK